jgi:peptidyl-dipeptidase A
MKLFTSKLIMIAFALLIFSSCSKKEDVQQGPSVMEKEFMKFADEHEAKLKTITIDWFNSYFNASIKSNDTTWKEVSNKEIKYNEIVSNKAAFAQLKKFKESNEIKDPIQKRRLDVLYNEVLSKQIDTAKLNELTLMGTNIEKKYSSFRAKVGADTLTDNDVEKVLKTSKNQKELENTWLAHKAIGPYIEKDILDLVRKRNAAAKELGFNNFHEMSLKLSFQDPNEILKLFDELDILTKDAFAKVKGEIDLSLAKQNRIKVEDLMPWHYQNRYFQEAPKIYDVDLDKYYKDKDVVKLTVEYYKSLNLPIDAIVAKSDLYEKPNKNQHAYCISVDRDAHDIRVLCNVKNNTNWQETMLHEYGHALYENYYPTDLPWSLKTPAHTFTTESIAMLFGRFGSKPQWIKDMVGISPEEQKTISETCFKILKTQQLVFSRWAQVMYRFEKSMYENPEQDLNKLWWDLVEKYQMVKKPKDRNMPDWATKIHIATSPCYYHNYLMGELLASQLYNTIATKVLNATDKENLSFYNQPKVGEFLIENIFKVGAKYEWNDMIEKATGEKLTAKYYAEQFVK